MYPAVDQLFHNHWKFASELNYFNDSKLKNWYKKNLNFK